MLASKLALQRALVRRGEAFAEVLFDVMTGMAKKIEVLLAGSGGGMLVHEDLLQHGGELAMEFCESRRGGGCLRVGGHFHQWLPSSSRFTGCKAGWGGCMDVRQSMEVSGFNSFDACTTSGYLDIIRILLGKLALGSIA